MRVLVTGSRNYPRKPKRAKRIYDTIHAIADKFPNATIVHGNGRGADIFAANLARALGLKVEEHHPNWDDGPHDKANLRNIKMVKTLPNVVVAFWDQRTKGTRHCLKVALDHNLSVYIYDHRGDLLKHPRLAVDLHPRPKLPWKAERARKKRAVKTVTPPAEPIPGHETDDAPFEKATP